MQIQGKHALVTGGGKRVAKIIAETLMDLGANLSVHHRESREEAEGVVKMAIARGLKSVAVHADLAKPAEIAAAVATAEKALGPVDILINSASIFHPTPTLNTSVEAWDELLNINLRGQFFFAQAVLKQMGTRGGVILNIADVHAAKPIRNYTPYAISKAGLVMMTRNLAREWAPRVRVNSISPGPVLLPKDYTEEKKQQSIERTLLKRVGSPRDVAAAAIFLIENEYVTGYDLRVDGGRSLV